MRILAGRGDIHSNISTELWWWGILPTYTIKGRERHVDKFSLNLAFGTQFQCLIPNSLDLFLFLDVVCISTLHTLGEVAVGHR
jgi:hypothetical protein